MITKLLRACEKILRENGSEQSLSELKEELSLFEGLVIPDPAFLDRARSIWQSEDLSIDDNSVCNSVVGGSWIQAWAFVDSGEDYGEV